MYLFKGTSMHKDIQKDLHSTHCQSYKNVRWCINNFYFILMYSAKFELLPAWMCEMGHFQCASSRPHCHLDLEWRFLPIQCTNRNKYCSETLFHQRYAFSVYLKQKLNDFFSGHIGIPINGVHIVKIYIFYSILCTCTCIWILRKHINIWGQTFMDN